jgi:uncharacterized protein (TIGR03067 family)
MRPAHSRFTLGWLTVALVVLGGVAADEPKASERAAAMQLRGAWRPESVTEYGRKLAGVDLETYMGMTLTIEDGNKFTLKAADGFVFEVHELKVDAGRDPKSFDSKEVEGLGVGTTYKGIWEVEGDTLKWCFGTEERPKRFDSEKGSDIIMIVLNRQKPK